METSRNVADEGSGRWDAVRGSRGSEARSSDHRRRQCVAPLTLGQVCVDAKRPPPVEEVMYECSEDSSYDEKERLRDEGRQSSFRRQARVALDLCALVPPPGLGSYASIGQRHRSARNRGRRRRRRGFVVQNLAGGGVVAGYRDEADSWQPAAACASDVDSRVAPSFLVVEEEPSLSAQLASVGLRVQPALSPRLGAAPLQEALAHLERLLQTRSLWGSWVIVSAKHWVSSRQHRLNIVAVLQLLLRFPAHLTVSSLEVDTRLDGCQYGAESQTPLHARTESSLIS